MAEYPFVFLYLLYITSYKKRAKVVEMRFFFVLLTKKKLGRQPLGQRHCRCLPDKKLRLS